MKKKIILFSLIFFSAFTLAEDFRVDSIKFKCLEKGMCKNTRFIFNSLVKTYNSYEHFKTVLKLYAANEGIQEFYYSINRDNNENILYIKTKERLKIVKIYEFDFKGESEIEIPTILPIAEDNFFDEKKLEDTRNLIIENAKERGYEYSKVNFKIVKEVGGIGIKTEVDLGKPILIQDIILSTKSNYIKRFISSKIMSYKNQPFAVQEMRAKIDELKLVLQDFGYYTIDISLKFQMKKDNNVVVYVLIDNVERFTFYFLKSDVLEPSDYKNELASQMIVSKREFSNEDIRSQISQRLEKLGYHFTNIETNKSKSTDKYGDPMTYYKVKVSTDKRVSNKGVFFKGNRFFSQKELEKFFRENAPEQARLGFYSPVYYNEFKSALREKYIAAGFVNISVDDPNVQFNRNDATEYVTFKIREGNRAIVRSIRVTGVEPTDRNEVYKILEIDEGKAFNPILFKDNISQIRNYFKQAGFYFIKISNRNEKNFVQYDEENTFVDITIEIETGAKIIAGDIIIIGNKKTRKRLILREISFKEGDIITSENLERSQGNLLSLGIFSSVQIKPVSEGTTYSDILIFVREKDFGLFEIAPGVRTDIGFKLSTALSYNNIDGLNKRISIQGTVNRRFDLHALDDERRKSGKQRIEYDTSINYSENSIFHSNVDFSLSLSKSRKRFFSYDADIQRVGYSFSQDFTPWFNFTFRQQIEGISQYEATDETNHGQFQIGSLTPSVTFDFRDRAVNPTKGALFDLSYELANPYTLSQQENDLTIDYYKMISRNKFYYPISNNIVLALSATFGIQETLSNRGENSSGESTVRIPSIKVFRLAGADIIRGFEDDEINRLSSGDDISDYEVNNRAYMAAIKFEPRYFLSDSMIVGAFYDAGRVFVDEFSTDDLRSSVGLSFKYVTPVGTLDFDYGIKLLRKKDSSGTLESPGRLHVSIGFF